MLENELKLAHCATINGQLVRFYLDMEDPQLPWCSWSDLLGMLNIPCRSDVTAALATSFSESFRPIADAESAVSTFAAVDFLDGFALSEVRNAWREANTDVLVAQAGGYDELGIVAMTAARDRSVEIENAAWSGVRWQ